MPPASTASIFVVQHVGSDPSLLSLILETDGPLPAKFARHDECTDPGHVYVAPADHHLTLTRGCTRLDRTSKVHHTRPTGATLFTSAADVFGKRVVRVAYSPTAALTPVSLAFKT